LLIRGTTFQLFKGWLNETITAYDSGAEPEGRHAFFDLIVKSRRETGDVIEFGPLFDDVFYYIVAGMEAVSYVMSHGTYLILTNPEVKEKLERELFEAKLFIQDFNHRNIMGLPYLVCQPIMNTHCPLKISTDS
jgi:cytochrome P450